MESLLKATFEPAGKVEKAEEVVDPKADYLKKAKESIGGSMVFIEREKLLWDGK